MSIISKLNQVDSGWLENFIQLKIKGMPVAWRNETVLREEGAGILRGRHEQYEIVAGEIAQWLMLLLLFQRTRIQFSAPTR